MPHTLVWSSKDHPRNTIQVYVNEHFDAANRLMNRLFNFTPGRLEISNGRYYYQPSKEYKKFLVRFRGGIKLPRKH